MWKNTGTNATAEGEFTDGTPGSDPRSILGEAWLNMVQRELQNFVTNTGIVLSEGDEHQLTKAGTIVSGRPGADVAAAATLNVPVDGNVHVVTGTGVTITGVVATAPSPLYLAFAAANTLQHSAGLLLPSSKDVHLSAGDAVILVRSAAGWRCMQILGATGRRIQVFTASGTWIKDPQAKIIRVELWGAGGGGSSGRKGVSTGNASGAAGGGGGAFVERFFDASALGASETVTIGAGGLGGVGQTSLTTNGNSGSNGGNTTFGSLLTAFGGGFATGANATNSDSGAGGGVLSAANGGTSGAPFDSSSSTGQHFGGGDRDASVYGGGSGAFATSASSTELGYCSLLGGPGGGSGGGINGTDVVHANVQPTEGGGNVGTSGGGAAAGVNHATTPTAGANGVGRKGGGGGGSALTGSGAAGGAGGQPGAGGGGGGATNTGASSGAGGPGGDGMAVIYSW